MKKLGFWFLLVLLLGLGLVYIFIPSKIKVSILTGAQATIHGEFRSLNDEEEWEKWWRDSDGGQHIPGTPFRYDGSTFTLVKQAANAVKIQIENKGLKLETVLQLVTFTTDSTGASWSFEMPKSVNPLNRIKYFMAEKEIKNDMLEVMQIFSRFVSNPRNIYRFEIYRTSTRDTTLLSTRFLSRDFPGTAELYKNFDLLQKNILKQKGKQSGYPMMNVVKLADGSYETQIAIPTDHKLDNDGKIVFRYMVPGNFFGGDVTGGQYTVNEAQKQLDLFILDYKKSKMANAYQILVTDRIREPDTLKWITRLRIPVVE
jgi:hypothetical protein